MGLVTSGVQNMIGTVQGAAKTQTLGLAQAGDLSSQLGVNFAKAKDLVSETRIEISKMAAALPGENSDYNAINTQISATVASYAKGDIAKFKEDSLELTKRFGVLASVRGVDANMGGSAVNRVLSGNMGIGEAFGVNDIFQKNPLLRKFVDEQLKIIGKSESDWKALTTETRAKILKVSAKQAVADETIASFDGTVDSMIQIANSTLFDADTGLFGFLRKLKETGGRSGLDAVQGAMQTVGNLMNTLGIIGDNKILGIDPMAGIVATLDWFSDLSNTVNASLHGEKASVTPMLSKLFTDVFTNFNDLLKGSINVLSNIRWGDLGKQLGYLTGQVFTQIFTRLDWGAIAEGTIKAVYGLSDFVGGFLVGAIQGSLDELGSAIGRVFDYITHWVESTINGLGKNINTGVGHFVNNPVGATGDVLGGIVGRLNPFGDNGVVGALKSGGGIIGGVLNQPTSPLPIPTSPKDNRQAFAPTINVPVQNGSPQENAQAMLQALNQAYVQFSQNSLA